MVDRDAFVSAPRASVFSIMRIMGRLFQRFSLLLAVLLHLALLPGCFLSCSGNGEGYPGCKPAKPAAESRDIPQAPLERPGEKFFWNQPGYKCRNAAGIQVPSHVDAIRVN